VPLSHQDGNAAALLRRCENVELLASIVDSSDDAIIAKRLDGTILSWNRGAERIFGYSKEEVVGRHIDLLIPHDLRTDEEFIVAQLVAGNKVEHFETVRLHKDGQEIAVSLTVSPIHDAAGCIVGASKVARDITTRKLAEAKVALLASVVAFSDDAIISKTLDGVITSWNYSAERLCGFTASEAIGQHIGIIIPADRLEEEKSIIELLRQGKEVKHLETVRMSKNGNPIYVSVSIGPVRDSAGNVIGAAKVMRDIGERKKAEHDLLCHTKALEAANRELEAFAYAVAHDLKAPLRVIQNASVWLEEDLEKLLTPEARVNLALLRSRVQRMEKLLDDLLEYSRIGRTTNAKSGELISGSRLMENVLELLAPPNGFCIEVGSSLDNIQVVRMPLQQVLLNLISNAIKHHDKPTGRIEVAVEDSGSHYRFSVRDDGPGIPAQFHEQIFRMFQTLKSKDRVEGSGMGLAMVRKHVEVAGGEIHLESAVGQGSTFIFTWPKDNQAVRELISKSDSEGS
jgi:hypothetical protein